MIKPDCSAKPPVAEIHEVVAGYGDSVILNGLSLTIQEGEIHALLGANGAGKTSTLSLLLGFLRPRSGQVRVNGVDPVANPTTARRQVAYIPENVALYGHLSAHENIAYLLDLAGQPADPPAIREALSAAGLNSPAHDQRVSGFSKGMRQKVSIALALARKVPVLLLDEPTSGLDPQATAEFNRLLGVLRDRGIAILMVTHDLLAAADIADHIGFLRGGRLIEQFSAGAGQNRFDASALHRHYTEVS